MSTYGPAFDEKLDGARIRTQMEVIRDLMLSAGECDAFLGAPNRGGWRTLEEIAKLTGCHEASISAQLRHLRNGTGGYKGPRYVVEKRRRGQAKRGLWEYHLSQPETQAAQQLELRGAA